MAHEHQDVNKVTFASLLIALGIIYGDIGTSPLYVMSAVVSGVPINERLVIGSVSCVIWVLTLATTVKYILITLRADNKGEGGIFSLYSIVRREKKWLVVVAIIGGAMMLADGIITPSITVSSAVSELKVFNPNIPTLWIVLGILAGLFFVQRFGTATLGKSFGPIMVIWFSMMAIFGAIHLSDSLHILKAFNPYYAFDILRENPKGLGLLGAIFLCTTGAEALYSDLGHCGRKNIQLTWIYVKICLLLSYLGQGAFLLNHVGEIYTKNTFYALMPGWFLPFGILIATLASIVASQALITGSFTMVSEGISLNLYPRLTIDYPTNIKGQLYIPLVNNFLFIGCVAVVLYFIDPLRMEAAYGLAITFTMLMTTILLYFYMRKMKWNPIFLYSITAVFATLEIIFVLANVGKIAHGGFITLLIAAIIILLNWIWIKAYEIKNRHTEFVKIKHYTEQLVSLSHDSSFPKYATHLVYLTKAKHDDELEKGIIYSLLQKQPKRVRVTFYLGFRVQQRISIFLRYVIKDMLKNNEININSQYSFLKGSNGIGDFRFIYLEDVLSYESDENFVEKFVLSVQIFIKNFTATPEKWFGLDTAVVQAEKVPLIIRPVTGVKLHRIYGEEDV